MFGKLNEEIVYIQREIISSNTNTVDFDQQQQHDQNNMMVECLLPSSAGCLLPLTLLLLLKSIVKKACFKCDVRQFRQTSTINRIKRTINVNFIHIYDFAIKISQEMPS